jgi:hypothetical protein
MSLTLDPVTKASTVFVVRVGSARSRRQRLLDGPEFDTTLILLFPSRRTTAEPPAGIRLTRRPDTAGRETQLRPPQAHGPDLDLRRVRFR